MSEPDAEASTIWRRVDVGSIGHGVEGDVFDFRTKERAGSWTGRRPPR